MRTHARFPEVAPDAGHYESFYLKASHPEEPLAVWIRYTVHKRAGAAARGSLWLTVFDKTAGRPYAAKETLPSPTSGSGAYIAVGDSRLEPGRAAGHALDASWQLEFESSEEPLHHLPRSWMYGAKLPRTKLLSPYPAARFSGRVQAGPRTIELDHWLGMIGHNWGTEHAERWVWLHGARFEGPGGDAAWLDAALGRIKLGRLTTPWLANGALSLDGVRHRLGGPAHALGTRISETARDCEFVLTGKQVKVRGSVGADAEDFVGWVYADPDGSEHQTVNCSIADMTLTVERKGRADVTLGLRGGAAYELGMRERDHGIEIQPFGDG